MATLLTIAGVGLTCKLFLRSGLCTITVNGLDILKSFIDDPNRRAAGQGVVTGALVEDDRSSATDHVGNSVQSYFNVHFNSWRRFIHTITGDVGLMAL